MRTGNLCAVTDRESRGFWSTVGRTIACICICEFKSPGLSTLAARYYSYSIPNANDLDRRAALWLWLGDDVALVLVDFVAVVLLVEVEFELELRTEQFTKP